MDSKKVVDINSPEVEELRNQYNETQAKIKETEKKIKELEKEQIQKNKNKIHLAELINLAIKYSRQEITQEKLNEFGKKMTIRGYIPILDKMRILSYLAFRVNEAETNINELTVINLERDLFYDVILGEYAFIDVITNAEDLRTYSNMDLLYPIFVPFIMQYCKFDYNNFIKMIDRVFNIGNMEDLSRTLSSIDYNEIKKAREDNEKLIEDLEKNKEVIGNLKEIVVRTSPANDTLNKILQTEAKEEIKNDTKENINEISKDNNVKNLTEIKDKEQGKKRRGRPKKSSN